MSTPPEPEAPLSAPNVEPICHVNTVEIVGELAAPAEVRQLPNGEESISCRVVARTESAAQGGKPTATLSRDSIDCAAGAGAVGNRLLSYQPGDVVALVGALRHRYWRGAGGLMSRYEVEVTSVRRRRRSDA